MLTWSTQGDKRGPIRGSDGHRNIIYKTTTGDKVCDYRDLLCRKEATFDMSVEDDRQKKTMLITACWMTKGKNNVLSILQLKVYTLLCLLTKEKA